MKILKFGGSSAATPERIKSIIEETAFVFSAFGGVTDQLIHLSELALEGNVEYKQKLALLEKRHLDAVRELTPMSIQSTILAQVKVQINELEDVLHGVFLVKERTLRTRDYIMSFGERLSAFIICEAFNAQGLAAEFLDARKVIRTDNHFGHAKVDFEITNKLIRDHFNQHHQVQIITGFIASAENGETTTLGRSGSDYTAAIFAGALRASCLEIWTDVDGMMTADPRLVKKAFTVPQLSYEEAMELSHFGAKVIFPATMQPAMANQIPIGVKNTFNPKASGTNISANSVNGKLIKGISSMNNISLLNVQGSGMLGVVGTSMRLFARLAAEKINVILISQASSEHSICLAVESEVAPRAKSALEKEFAHEIKDKLIDDIKFVHHLAIVAVVGDGMKHQPGISGRMFNTLGKNGVNVVAIAQGSSERNISAVIQQSDVSKALNALHDAFFLSDKKTVHLFVVGTGQIGGALIRQIQEQHQNLENQNKLEVKLVGIANSRKMLFDENDLTFTSCVEKMKTGDEMNIRKFISQMISSNLPGSIFVDCTSSEEVASSYEEILSANISIVTPNKKANSGSLQKYKQLKQLAQKKGTRFLYETNVGAGLPVINTLNDLLLSGDRVISVEGVLSGTLNFIFSSFEQGKNFNDVVAEARAKGFTEPDPRDDLSGMDVARKLLILAREAGTSLELSDIEVENLVPENCRGEMTAQDFIDRLEDHNAYFENLRSSAELANEKLRYRAILKDGIASVKLESVKCDHPFHSLSGSDNIILLTTERYHDRPMIIRGPGAGAEVTASGVFADIIRIGNYSNQ
ncbi:MAG: bifunctional aspartate kinase/homoserine dehydrogenase I [Bacteroidetes bacterium]|nr:bifunctional aspartate kinase/homoserine dehydrogenase I [Bacteroidota bacterium]